MDCDGIQTCNAEGTAFSACQCESSAGSGGSSSTGAGGSQSNAGSGGGTSNGQNLIAGGVGDPCETDADCPTTDDGQALLTCISSSSNEMFGTGSPQGGYCTLRCSSNADCEAVDGFSGCADLQGGSFCVAVCNAGDDPFKCGTTRAHACFRVSQADPTAGGCFPMCTSDAGCGQGRFCDNSQPGLGLCREMAPAGGGPPGTPCTRETEAEDCASDICLTLSQNGTVLGGFCSALCTFLSPSGCGFDAGVTTTPKDFACINPFESGAGAGDVGLCVEVCDTDADCTQNADNGWVCRLFNNAQAEQFVGRLGQCVPAELGNNVSDAGPG